MEENLAAVQSPTAELLPTPDSSPVTTAPTQPPRPTPTSAPLVEPTPTLTVPQIFGLIDKGQITEAEAKKLLADRNDTTTSAPPKQESTPGQTLPSKEQKLTPTPNSSTNSGTSPTPVLIASPIILSGHGQQASPKLNLNQGLAIFRMSHDGEGHFAIILLDSQGNWVEVLVNRGGDFDGSKAVGIEKFGMYILESVVKSRNCCIATDLRNEIRS